MSKVVIDLDEAVTRFLGWRLPENFAPDGGISFRQSHPGIWPTGTNLLDATQARAMLENILAGATAAGVIGEVAAERRRQVEAEGWTAEHDDQHANGEMAQAGACYALWAAAPDDELGDQRLIRSFWPWGPAWWKPKNPRRDLIRAAALIVAEVERLDRAEAQEGRE